MLLAKFAKNFSVVAEIFPLRDKSQDNYQLLLVHSWQILRKYYRAYEIFEMGSREDGQDSSYSLPSVELHTKARITHG